MYSWVRRRLFRLTMPRVFGLRRLLLGSIWCFGFACRLTPHFRKMLHLFFGHFHLQQVLVPHHFFNLLDLLVR